MIRFSANLGFLWNDRPLLGAIKAASEAGFEAVELHFPYATPAGEVRAACARHGLKLLALNTNISQPPHAHFGFAATPGRTDEYRALVHQAFAYAQTAQAPFVHVMAGTIDPAQRHQASQTLVENLKWAAELAENTGLTILLEPLNNLDVPNYFFARTEQALEIIQMVGSPRIKLMFDAYHVGKKGDDILSTLRQSYSQIGHIQIASIPDRSEPDHGDFDYSLLFDALKKRTYPGWIGCEYFPRGKVEDGMNWRQRLSG